MSENDVVLVGVDGSPASLNAADWAAAYATAHGAAVHLVCTYSVPSFAAAGLDGGYARGRRHRARPGRAGRARGGRGAARGRRRRGHVGDGER